MKELRDYLFYQDDWCQIYCVDCREILPKLPKVDLVLTDPPYLKEFLWSYSTISQWAHQLLPEGGWCFVYGAVEHIRERLSRMDEFLTFHWIHALIHNGGYPRMWDKRIMSGYKPIFAYTNGKPSVKPWISSVHSDAMDKTFHEWGQGIGFSKKVIEMFTEPNQSVLEPFLGGGTTLRAAKDLNRKAIGIEIDPFSCEQTVKRLRQEVFDFRKTK